MFESLIQTHYQGIPGVKCIDSGKEGPNVGVTINTHANEPSGLITVWSLLHSYKIQEKITRGKIFFILNNIEATRLYFQSNSFEEKRAHRFIDVNMNRLPDDWESPKYDELSEVRRAKKLLPVYQLLDGAIDIHSTENKSEPMILEIQGEASEYFKGMHIEKLIRNIVPVQIGIPIGAIYGNRKTTPVFEIESGSHEDGKAFACAIESTRIFLENTGSIPSDLSIEKNEHPYEVFNVESSLIFPSSRHRLEKVYPSFYPMKKGEAIAFDQELSIYAPFDGHMVLPPAATFPSDIREEVMFFSSPSQMIDHL